MEYIKIISEGDSENTRVEMPDGTLIPGISWAKWECAVGELAKIELRGWGKIEARINGPQNIKMELKERPIKRVPLHWRRPEDRA